MFFKSITPDDLYYICIHRKEISVQSKHLFEHALNPALPTAKGPFCPPLPLWLQEASQGHRENVWSVEPHLISAWSPHW